MKFNDKPLHDIQSTYNNAAYKQETSGYQRGSLKESDYPNPRLTLSSKLMKKSPSSNLPQLIRGKENQAVNSQSNQNPKNAVTNHSFNGYFNENTEKMRKRTIQSISKKIQSSTTHINKPQALLPLQQSSQHPIFHSSTKLSNYHFTNNKNQSSSFNSTSLLNYQTTIIHEEVKTFITKYFSQSFSHCQQIFQLSQQFVSIQDFVDILFEQFDSLIGRQSTSVQFGEEFTEKVFVMFGGEKVYFGDLYEKTQQNGLTGLIFQIVKAINQDKNSSNFQEQQFQSKTSINKSNQPSSLLSKQQQQLIPLSPKNIISSNVNLYKNSQSIIKPTNNNNIEKISLNKFFGTSSTSNKIQFSNNNNKQQQPKSFFFDESTILYFDQNLQEVKKILSDFVEGMYEQAQLKLNKKYSQQIRKITLRYKETERLLEKINQKISSHYDTLQMQKQYDRKLKEITQKSTDLNEKVKKLQNQLKQSKDETEKQKLNYIKLDQQFAKIKEKLQKYENAIFEKAMQKGSSQSIINSNNRVNQNISMSGSIFSQNPLPVYGAKCPKQLEIKIDTVTDNIRPVIAPLHHSPSYSPYMSRQTDGSVNPIRTRDNRMQISPIKQSINFVKSPCNNTKLPSQTNQNSRISYSPMLNKVSEINKVEIGQRVSFIKPLTPMDKMIMGETQQNTRINNTNTNSRINIHMENNSTHQVKYLANHSNPSTYSPLKVQFCTSQVGNFNLPKS